MRSPASAAVGTWLPTAVGQLDFKQPIQDRWTYGLRLSVVLLSKPWETILGKDRGRFAVRGSTDVGRDCQARPGLTRERRDYR